ncbi:MAG: cell division protein ZapA [Micropepsaceae bacterium]
MPLVNVLINTRAYTVACDDGEEERLRDVSQILDKRVRELASSVGQVGDTRLLVMAGLVICDELSETLERLDKIEKKFAELKGKRGGDSEESENALAEMIENASERLEAIAARIAPP